MGMFKRIGDIVSANLGEMADQFEDPELMLKQAIREMGESIDDATQETAKAIANQRKLARELAHNESEARNWQARAEKAVLSQDDELARKALIRKSEHDKLAVALRDQIAAAKDASQTLRRQLDGMKAKLTEAKRNLATLAARNKAAEVRKKIYTGKSNMEIEVDNSAFETFERLRSKVEQAELEADALAELQGGLVEPSADTSSVNDEIEEQLKALKQKDSASHD